MRSGRLGSVVAALVGLLVSRTSLAGPVEELAEIAMHPTNDSVMALRYLNGGSGLFVTTDGGKEWKLLCGAAMFGKLLGIKPEVSYSGDGILNVSVADGLVHDDGHGCGFTSVPAYDGVWVRAFALDPSTPLVTYGATCDVGNNGLVRRDASGNWTDLGPKDSVCYVDLHVVAKGSGLRFYATVIRYDDAGAGKNFVRVSDDAGTTWSEHPAPAGVLRIEGVDPKNPDRIVASLSDPSAPDSVLVSSDQGQSFSSYLGITEIGGVTFAPDGRVWIGDAGDPSSSSAPRGLWAAPDLGTAPTKLSKSNYSVRCLEYRASTDTLYVCEPWTFGTADASDGTFTASFDVRKVASFVSCDGVDMASTCEVQLCGAYCGTGHFAQAPVCCAYDSPTCGPAAAEAETSCGAGSGTDGGQKGGTLPPGTTHDTSSCRCELGSGGTAWPFRATTCAVLASAGVLFRRRRRAARERLPGR